MNLLSIDWGAATELVIFGIVMVFIILVLLVFLIDALGKILAPKIDKVKTKFTKSPHSNKVKLETTIVKELVSADENAAIAMALHLFYSEEHDEESDVITIKSVERRYSPWSSKIYGLDYIRK